MTNRIWAIGAAIVIVGILGLGYLLGVSPLLSQAAAADAQRTSVEQSNQAQLALLAQMKGDYDRLDELTEQVGALRLSIPGEVDSDVIFSYLGGIQVGTGAPVDSILIGEAQTYGMPTATDGTTAPATTEAPAATDAAADPAAPPATVPGVADLYTVPVTITFQAGTPASQVLAFAGAMQNGPRLFLVTSIAREASSEASATITAFMFVIADADDTPGAAGDALDEALKNFAIPTVGLWPQKTGATPEPTESATPEPTDSATPAPTPTGTPAP